MVHLKLCFYIYYIYLCSELIQRYRQKAAECEQYKQQLKDLQTKLSIEEKGRKGLSAELSILHKVSAPNFFYVLCGSSVCNLIDC